MPTIKGKLGGYNKKEVDEHIRKVKKAHDLELEDLDNKLDVCQWEIEILKQELDNLTRKNRSFPEQRLLEYAINKVDRVLEFMDQDTTIDVLAIDKITLQKEVALETKIDELDKEIDKEKEIIEKELNSIADIAKGQERAKPINIDVLKNIGKVLPIADWLKSNREDQSNPNKEFWGEESNDQTQKSSEQITSDGMSLSDTTLNTNSNLGNPTFKHEESHEIEVFNVNKVSDPVEQEEGYPNFEETMGNFDHEDESSHLVEQTLNHEAIVGDAAPTEAENGTNPSNMESVNSSYYEGLEIGEPFFSVSKSDFWDTSSSSEEIAIPTILEVAATEDDLKVEASRQDLSTPLESMDAPSQTISSGLSQADVRDEISSVRDKYIIGRVAGEDITDSTGQIIIHKNQPITLSLMQMAQKEGKLADLIIHMVLPGQEE